jgi:hypothetical protein
MQYREEYAHFFLSVPLKRPPPRIYPSGDNIVTNHLASPFETVRVLALSSTESAPTDASGVNFITQILVRADSFAESHLWLADLVCVETVAWLPDTNQAMVNMRRSCIQWLGPTQTEPTTESSWNTVCYLAGCLTKFRATGELTSSIVDTLVRCKPLP